MVINIATFTSTTTRCITKNIVICSWITSIFHVYIRIWFIKTRRIIILIIIINIIIIIIIINIVIFFSITSTIIMIAFFTVSKINFRKLSETS